MCIHYNLHLLISATLVLTLWHEHSANLHSILGGLSRPYLIRIDPLRHWLNSWTYSILRVSIKNKCRKAALVVGHTRHIESKDNKTHVFSPLFLVISVIILCTKWEYLLAESKTTQKVTMPMFSSSVYLYQDLYVINYIGDIFHTVQ